MREEKYRIFDKDQKIMYKAMNLYDILSGDCEYESIDGEYTLPHKDFIFYFNDHLLINYIGLEGKNDVEIYEGDIITFEAHLTCFPESKNTLTCVVIWVKSDARYMLSDHANQQLYDFSFSKNVYEVIGTIYK